MKIALELLLHFNRSGVGWVVRRCWVNFQCRVVLIIWIVVGQGPIALAIGAGVFFFFFTFFLSSITSLFCRPLSRRRSDINVALLFYVHGKHLRSCRDGQLT